MKRIHALVVIIVSAMILMACTHTLDRSITVGPIHLNKTLSIEKTAHVHHRTDGRFSGTTVPTKLGLIFTFYKPGLYYIETAQRVFGQEYVTVEKHYIEVSDDHSVVPIGLIYDFHRVRIVHVHQQTAKEYRAYFYNVSTHSSHKVITEDE